MTRIMYDTINTSVADIPANPEMVAGYVDGAYVWSDADWNRFPDAVKVRIAVFANTNDGHVLDVEQGNATPAQAPGWANQRRLAGIEPTIYCSYSNWNTIHNQFVAQNIELPLWWIAEYDGIAAIPTGAIAKQYLNFEIPKNYDQSIVADYWPGVDDMAIAEADILRILNYPLPRQGEAGTTSLAGLIQWNDIHVQRISNLINEQNVLLKAIAKKLGAV